VRTGWFNAGKISAKKIRSKQEQEIDFLAYESADLVCSAQGRGKNDRLCLSDSAVYTAKHSDLNQGRSRISFRGLPTPTVLTSATTSSIVQLLTRVFPMGIVYLTS
jgi:hypothetical protein